LKEIKSTLRSQAHWQVPQKPTAQIKTFQRACLPHPISMM